MIQRAGTCIRAIWENFQFVFTLNETVKEKYASVPGTISKTIIESMERTCNAVIHRKRQRTENEALGAYQLSS